VSSSRMPSTTGLSVPTATALSLPLVECLPAVAAVEAEVAELKQLQADVSARKVGV
jgi:hypothetical protein